MPHLPLEAYEFSGAVHSKRLRDRPWHTHTQIQTLTRTNTPTHTEKYTVGGVWVHIRSESGGAVHSKRLCQSAHDAHTNTQHKHMHTQIQTLTRIHSARETYHWRRVSSHKKWERRCRPQQATLSARPHSSPDLQNERKSKSCRRITCKRYYKY